jgi:hypothetical protein
MNSEQILFKEFDAIRVDLIKAYDAKGMRASGKWADSLQVEASPLNAVITGLSYSQQLETGRRAGGFPPIASIEQWIRDKGITPIEISISSLAFLIARKIAREGWNREGYGGVELISEVVTDKRIQDIIEKVGEVTLFEYTTEIIKMIKEI